MTNKQKFGFVFLPVVILIVINSLIAYYFGVNETEKKYQSNKTVVYALNHKGDIELIKLAREKVNENADNQLEETVSILFKQ